MKTILITGSTDGIGNLLAFKLAEEGHQVIVHGRNPEKLERTIKEIESRSNNKHISGHLADLSSFKDLEKLITELTETYSKIDVLINNAGIFKSNIQQTKNHLDIRFAVNYFAPYILSNGLIPLLEKSDSPRLINLSSAAQKSFSWKALSGEEKHPPQDAYAQSKLALTMWSFAFAQIHPEILTIAVNPGSLLNTKMVKEAYGHHWSSADKGANILYDLSLSEKYINSSGKYFDNDKGTFNTAHSDAYDQEKITMLISETEKLINT